MLKFDSNKSPSNFHQNDTLTKESECSLIKIDDVQKNETSKLSKLKGIFLNRKVIIPTIVCTVAGGIALCIYYLYNTSDTGLVDRKIAALNTTTTSNGLTSNTTELNDTISTTLDYISDLYHQAKEKIYAHELDALCLDNKKAYELLISVKEDETKSIEYWEDLHSFLYKYCQSSPEDRADIKIPEEFKEYLANFLSE